MRTAMIDRGGGGRAGPAPAVLRAIGAAWLAQRGALLAWAPVCLAGGIGAYFALRWEPSGAALAALAGAAAFLALLAVAAQRTGAAPAAPLAVGLALFAAGLALAGMRAHNVAAPQLAFRYYGPIEGRIVAVDRSASDALRLTLDHVVLERTSPARTPGRVRVSVHGNGPLDIDPVPGLTVVLTGHLSPPQGPVEPGGFDFRRHAWFQGLGATGYTSSPVLMLEPAAPGLSLALARARQAFSARIRSALPGEAGAFAAAIMSGDRSAIGQDTFGALRASNLAHLLAISGLHMGLLAGFAFGVLRLALAAVPWVALRWPVRKIAALGALAVAAAYLALSGGSVSTQRAFVMVSVALVAVLFDRRAFSLRAVAVAAMIVLVLRPEALLGPGFQMSFAATAALIAVFEAIRERNIDLGPAWLRPVAAVVISSAVAGAATAPFGAAHFGQLAHYGLLANLASVPLMGALVMPAAVVAALLIPIGMEAPVLWVMGKGLDWILHVAHGVSEWEGATGHIVKPGAPVLPLLALGGLVLILVRGRMRAAGPVLMMAAGLLWWGAARPPVLIEASGALVGVATPEGRALSRRRGAGFVGRNWLANDGDGAGRAAAHARWPGGEGNGISRFDLPQGAIVHVAGKTGARLFDGCEAGDLVIYGTMPEAAPEGVAPGCRILTPNDLRHTGALALYLGDAEGRTVSAADLVGRRLWTQ